MSKGVPYDPTTQARFVQDALNYDREDFQELLSCASQTDLDSIFADSSYEESQLPENTTIEFDGRRFSTLSEAYRLPTGKLLTVISIRSDL